MLVMNKIYTCVFVFAVVLFLSACEQKNVELYENEPALYFWRGTDYTRDFRQYDSLSYSFFVKEAARERDTVYVQLRTMGLPVDKPRAINLVQTNAGAKNAAVAGTHYVAFDDAAVVSRMVVPAGAVVTDIPVIILRDTSMKKQEFLLNLEIGRNENFEVGLEDQKTFRIKISDMTFKPSNWSSWQTYFGDWGSVKMWFIINYVGVSDFDNYSQYSQAMLDFYKMKASQKLEEYNKNNNTILTEDDKITVVVFPQ